MKTQIKHNKSANEFQPGIPARLLKREGVKEIVTAINDDPELWQAVSFGSTKEDYIQRIASHRRAS
jgi:hypothetical protein